MVMRPNRFIWLGSHKLFDAFTFDFRRTEHGWFQAHIYKFDEDTSTFIVETTEDIFKAHGLDQADEARSIAFCEELFSEVLDGGKLMSNARHLRGSAWLNFGRLICGKWSHFNGQSHVVLMGDAAHTAHFAIGSGTKLALEDAIELTKQFRALGGTADKIPAVLAAYEEVRAVDAARLQNAARNAMEWFEVVGSRYADTLEPEQFMYSLLTRSQRISHENLRLRDKKWLEDYERWFAARAGINIDPDGPPVPPMFTPYRVRGLTLANRIVMSPMAMYSARDGVPNDFHLVHFGSRALGGAGLLFGEMTCVSPDARITPGCLGLWNDEQAAAWKRIVDFVHTTTPAKFGLQLGHAGRKGSTRLAWEGIDQPLDDGNWPLISASALPYMANSQVPRAMTQADMDRVKADFVAATKRAIDGWLRYSRTALCPRLSAVVFPFAADEPPQRRIWRRRTKTMPVIRWRCFAPSARYGRKTSRFRFGSRVMTGPMAAIRPPMRRSTPKCSRTPAPISSIALPGKFPRRRSRFMGACSRLRLRTSSAMRLALRPWRSVQFRKPTTRIQSSRQAAPTFAPSRDRISPIPLGLCTKRLKSA